MGKDVTITDFFQNLTIGDVEAVLQVITFAMIGTLVVMVALGGLVVWLGGRRGERK